MLRKEIALPEDLFNKLTIKASENGISLNGLIRMYLIKCLKEKNINEEY